MPRRVAPQSKVAENEGQPAIPCLRPAAGAAARKLYVRPALQAYGTLVEVTGFGGSKQVDSGAGNLETP